MDDRNLLLMDIRDYLWSELKAWNESGTKEIPSILNSLLDDINVELSLGNCEWCNGPMVTDPQYYGTFCGSWLYMTGGCHPPPERKNAN